MKRLLFAAVLAFRALSAESLNDPIDTKSKVTYADLLRLVCKDLEVNDADPMTAMTAEGADCAKTRQLEGKDAPAAWGGSVTIGKVDRPTTQVPAGQVLLTFTVDVDSEPKQLALFELTPVPRLLDLGQLERFPDDDVAIQQRISLSADTEAMVFSCYHHNSSQGYQLLQIVFVHGGKLNFLESVGLLGCNGCTFGVFGEDIQFTTVPDPGRLFRQVTIAVTLTREEDGPEVDYRPRMHKLKRVYTATYRWNAATKKFVTGSKELIALAALNGKNN
jgi:hypothetical protein